MSWREVGVSAAVLLFAAAPAGAAGPVGQLTPDPGGCIANTADDGCVDGRALSGAGAPLVTPDGRQVLVPAWASGSVANLARGADGRLSQLSGTHGCTADDSFVETPPCVNGRNLQGARDLVIAPSGRFAFIAGDNGVAAHERAPDTGGLLPVAPYGCIAPDGQSSDDPVGSYECANGRVISRLSAVAISPDGRHLYAGHDGVAAADEAIAIIHVDASAALSQPSGAAGCLRNGGNSSTPSDQAVPEAPGQPAEGLGCSNLDLPTLGTPTDIAVSADGATVYVTSTGGVHALRRAAGDGSLTPLGCINSGGTGGCGDGRAMDGGAGALALSPDGHTLYAAAVGSAAVAVLRVGPDGSLSQAGDTSGCVSDTGAVVDGGPCIDGQALGPSPTSIAVAPDGRTVLVGVFGVGPQMAVLARAGDGGVMPAGCFSRDGSATGGGTCVTTPVVGAMGVGFSPTGEHVYVSDGSAIAPYRREVAPSCGAPARAGTTVGMPVTVTLQCSDANGDAVSLSATGAPVSLSGTAVTVTPATPGLHRLTITPSDGVNAGAPVELLVDAAAAAPPPPPPGVIPPSPLPTTSARTFRRDRRGRYALKLTCPRTAIVRCRGTFELRTNRPRHRVLRGRFDLAPGRSRTFRARASKSLVRALRRRRGSLKGTLRLLSPARATYAASARTIAVRMKLR